MSIILPAYAGNETEPGETAQIPDKAPKNTEKRYRFFTIDRLAKVGGAVYNEKNLDDLNGAFYEKMV